MSIFNIIEEISAPSFPIVVPLFTIVTVVMRDEHDDGDSHRIRCRIMLNETELVATDLAFNYLGRSGAKVITQGQGILIPNPGKLTVSLLREERILAEWPIMIQHIGQAYFANVDSAPANQPATPNT